MQLRQGLPQVPRLAPERPAARALIRGWSEAGWAAAPLAGRAWWLRT
jgi:hypothetical protein